MPNPLRSEADAFRMVVIVGAAAAAVIALALAAGPRWGALLGLLLIGIAIGAVWRQSRRAAPRKAEIAITDAPGHRILVVADRTAGGRALLDEIKRRSRSEGSEGEVLIVSPASASRLAVWASATDDASAEARGRLEELAGALEDAGLRAMGEVGDSDPNVALADALRGFAADEVIIATLPGRRSKWAKRGVIERARKQVDLPVTHVVVDPDAEGAATPR